MGQITREERNKFQEVNRIKDVDQILEVKKVYDAILKFMDQERAAGTKLTQIENQTRAELRGYSKTIEDAYNAYKAGNKITSNMADDMKSHIRLVTKKLIQLEQDVNTRTRGSTYKGFNQDLAVATLKSLTRVYKEQSSYARIMKQNIQRNKTVVPKIDTTPQRLPNPLDGRLPTTWRDKSPLQLYKKYTTKTNSNANNQNTVEFTQLPTDYFAKIIREREAEFELISDHFKQLKEQFMAGNFFRDIHVAFGGLPGVGKITGSAARIAKGYGSGISAGDKLKEVAPAFGKAGLKVAGLAKFLGPAGAIASGIALIYNQMKKSSPVLQAVSNLFELAWNLLWMPLGNALGTLLLPMAEDLINFAIAFNELFTDFSMEKLGEVMYGALQFIWGAIFDLSNAIPTAVVNGTLDMLSNLFRSLGWDGAADAIDNFKNIMTDVREFIRNLPMKLWDYVKGFWQGVFDFFKDPVGKLSSAFEKLGNFIVEGFSKITSGASDWLDSLNPHWFATGGIVTGPTLGVVGEAGPEAVVPLDKANGIGTTYVININGDVYGVSDLESRIERAIQRTANKAYYR